MLKSFSLNTYSLVIPRFLVVKDDINDYYSKRKDVMEFHFVEMPKLILAWKEDQFDPWNDLLVRWLLLLGVVDRKNDKIYEDILRELEEIAVNDETLKEAFQT